MAKSGRKTLTHKIYILLLKSMLIAAIIWGLLFFLGNSLIGDYLICSDYIQKQEKKYIDAFQSYVTQNFVSASDAVALGKWAHTNHIAHITVSRRRKLLYDSAYSDTLLLHDAYSDDLHYNWQYFYSVTFSDGEADVYIYANYEEFLYMMYYIFDTFLCIMIWLSLFAFGFRREVRYIRQLSRVVSQIELGDLQVTVPIKGRDELGTLAYGLDQMRLSLLEKENTEKELRKMQNELVLGMAHDLRTPLTGLMAFLEIARKQGQVQDCHTFIDKSYKKATQIRDLTNQLFDFFFIHAQKPIALDPPEAAAYALGEYLSELYGLLENEGFAVISETLHWEPVHIRICADYIRRIIDNLVSNIKKYADSSHPVFLSSEYSATYVCIILKNRFSDPGQYVKGTGIGVKNITSMMEQMGGHCEVQITPEAYSIRMSFPICS